MKITKEKSFTKDKFVIVFGIIVMIVLLSLGYKVNDISIFGLEFSKPTKTTNPEISKINSLKEKCISDTHIREVSEIGSKKSIL